MFFDLHSDILYHIVQKKLDQKKNIIKDYHLRQLEKGMIKASIWDYYTDIDHPLCEFNRAIDYILEEIELSKDVVQVVKSKNDFNQHKINIILGFESLQPVKDIHQLKTLYDLGFRQAMLTWNEQNHFATGVLGDVSRGLTLLGAEVIQFMNDNRMIIDVSHANEKTFDDILELSTSPVIASHSNIYTLCSHKRNLSDNQVDKLFQKGGIMGITAVKNFINPINPTVDEMVKHIDYLKTNYAINHIGLGFDFMDYLGGSNLDDLTDATKTNNLIKALQEKNYTDEEIYQITYLNAYKIINQIL